MKKIMLMAAALMAVTAVSAQNVSMPSQNDLIELARAQKQENTVEVTGRAEKEIVPDEIYIRIVIDETALKQKQTVEKMESDMIAALKKLSINTDKDLKIGNMSSQYKDYFLKQNTARTSASYELKVSGVQLLGKTYQALEGLGISNLNITKLSHSKIKEFQEELRIEALKNAQQLAQRLAEAVGQKAGRAVQIVDYNNEMYVAAPRMEYMAAKSFAVADNAMYETELEFKDIKLTYNIQAKFALE